MSLKTNITHFLSPVVLRLYTGTYVQSMLNVCMKMSLCNPVYIQRKIEREQSRKKIEKKEKERKNEGNNILFPVAREETQDEDRLSRLHPAFSEHVHTSKVSAFQQNEIQQTCSTNL